MKGKNIFTKILSSSLVITMTFSLCVGVRTGDSSSVEALENSNRSSEVISDGVVAKIGETEYNSFEEAVDAAKASTNDETIKLFSDVTLNERVSFDKNDVTLDLNGHTILQGDSFSSTDSYLIVCRKNSLTVCDSSGKNTGKITSKINTIYILETGCLNLESGIIESTAESSAEVNAILLNGATSLNITGGKITGSYNGIKTYQNFTGNINVCNVNITAKFPIRSTGSGEITINNVVIDSINNDGKNNNNGIRLEKGDVKLNIKEGTKITGETYGIYTLSEYNGTITINGGEINSRIPIYAIGSGTITIKSGNIGSTDNSSGIRLEEGNTNLNIEEGTKITGESYGIYTLNGYSGAITINGGEINAKQAINASSGEKITINNGTLTGATYGVYIKNVELIVNGGAINGNSYNGIRSIGNTKININDGEIFGVSYSVYAEGNDSSTINVNGGKFSNNNSGNKNIGIAASSTDKVILVISGGEFNRVVDNNYLNPECRVEQAGENWKVVSAAKVVNDNGEQQYFKTLQKAIDNVNSKSTIMLLEDRVENIIISEGKDIVLNLNGHTLSGVEGQKQDVLTNNGILTVTDSSESKMGAIVGNENGVALTNNGNCTIDNGKISSDTSNALVCLADTEITGGTIDGSVVVLTHNDSNATLNITGGTIGRNNDYIRAWNSYENGSAAENAPIINISGNAVVNGTLQAVETKSDGNNYICRDRNIASIIATGGLFSKKVPDYACLDGYASQIGSDGYYTIKTAVSTKYIGGSLLVKETFEKVNMRFSYTFALPEGCTIDDVELQWHWGTSESNLNKIVTTTKWSKNEDGTYTANLVINNVPVINGGYEKNVYAQFVATCKDTVSIDIKQNIGDINEQSAKTVAHSMLLSNSITEEQKTYIKQLISTYENQNSDETE